MLDSEIDANKKKKELIEDRLKSLKDKIEIAQDKADANQQKHIKILKNRNGANNKICHLTSYPNRFLFKDI